MGGICPDFIRRVIAGTTVEEDREMLSHLFCGAPQVKVAYESLNVQYEWTGE